MIDGRFAAYVALMGLLIIIPDPDMLMVTRPWVVLRRWFERVAGAC